MYVDLATVTTYGLLAIAILSAWMKPIRVRGSLTVSPWLLVFGASCGAGLTNGLVTWQGVFALAAFGALAYTAANHQRGGILKVSLLFATGWMTLALSIHKFPGFANPALVSNIQIGIGAPAFTHRLNFDTVAAGLILFAVFCIPSRTREEWREVFRQYPIVLGTAIAVLACGLVVDYVNVDPKLVAYTPVFLSFNLLFTCVTEETFFRGFIQQQLEAGMKRLRFGAYFAMALAAVLFGIAHAKGGPLLICLATLAGLGNGYAYLRSRRIEAAILTHFTLNALHFMAFTYPRTL